MDDLHKMRVMSLLNDVGGRCLPTDVDGWIPIVDMMLENSSLPMTLESSLRQDTVAFRAAAAAAAALNE
jgi:hypothetical protein